jgi:uncharacterized protein
MSSLFANLAFTADVKALQSQMGSRQIYERLETGVTTNDLLGQYEISFIESRDSFYQASVSTSNWPYVQHRGGPKGFLKVLDSTHIAYADLSGNKQYVSVGNLSGNDRVSLIMVDYPNRRRLKIMGRARFAQQAEEPDLCAQLTMPEVRAKVDHAVIIHVEAWDWNCPKHLTQRYTEQEIAQILAPLQKENNQLRELLTRNNIAF